MTEAPEAPVVPLGNVKFNQPDDKPDYPDEGSVTLFVFGHALAPAHTIDYLMNQESDEIDEGIDEGETWAEDDEDAMIM